MDNVVKKVILIQAMFVIILIGMGLAGSTESPQSTKYDSIIVFKVKNLTVDQFRKIQTAFDLEPTANVEYNCLWSGVIIVKLFESSFHNKGDIQMFVKAKINKATTIQGLEFYHIYTEASGSATKC